MDKNSQIFFWFYLSISQSFDVGFLDSFCCRIRLTCFVFALNNSLSSVETCFFFPFLFLFAILVSYYCVGIDNLRGNMVCHLTVLPELRGSGCVWIIKIYERKNMKND